MALSGTITGTCDNTSYTLTCEWSATQSVANNTSSITAKVYLVAPSGWSTASSSWSCVINGTTVTSGSNKTVGSTKVLLGKRTWTVNHASDGTCSVKISFSYSNSLSSAGTYTTKKGSGSKSVTLDKIARTSSFTLSSSSLDMGASQTVTISKANSSFTHTVQYTFGGTTTTSHTKTTSTSVSFTPPVSLASKIPNATSGTCTVKVTTYSGDTSIGSTSKTFTLKVPSSVKPTVTLATTYYNRLGELFLAGKSTVKVTPTGTGAYSSTIKEYSYSGAGLSGTGSSKTTGTLSAGSYTITVTVKDSRGRTNTASVSFKVYAYSSPTCSISAFRADSSGNATASGTNARLKLTWNLSNPNSANTNAHTYKIEYKTTSASTWIEAKSGTLSPAYSDSNASDNYNPNVTIETTTSYQFRFTVTDSFSSASATCTLSTIGALLNIEANGVGIGKIYEQGKLDIGGNVYVTDGVIRFAGSPSAYSRIGYYSQVEDGEVGCTFIANGSNNWFRLKDDGTMTWRGKDVYYAGYDGNIEINRGIKLGNFSNDSFYCVDMKRYNSTVGYIHTKIGITHIDSSEPAMAIEVGEDSSATSGSFTLGIRYRFAKTSFTVATSNKVSIGTSSSKFTAVYATNGTIQTSDGRYKYILEDVDNQTCYELIKDMNLYGYSTLNKRIDEYVDTTEISDELQESSKKDMNLHMGFVAQEIEDSELAKYILIKDETEDGDHVFGVDNYAYTTAIHGALQHEIDLRDKQFEELKKENENLKNELQELKQTILKGE